LLGRLKTRKKINAALASAYVFGFLYSALWTFLSQKLDFPLMRGIKESSDYIAYFATGIFCLINFEWLKKRQKFFWAPGLVIVVLEYMFTFNTALEFLFPAGLGAVIMFAAFNFSRLRNVGRYGDYSYGIYIFHGPILKILIDLGYYAVNEYVTVVAGMGMVFSAAYISWHFVEKKALKRAAR
jgi:peptidoglycan/LPS O-acetylase OafA/YrhL